MPYQIHRLIHGQVGVILPCKCTVHNHSLHVAYALLLHVTDIAIPGGNLNPVFQFFHKQKIIAFVNLAQDFRLDSASVAHIRILICSYH